MPLSAETPAPVRRVMRSPVFKASAIMRAKGAIGVCIKSKSPAFLLMAAHCKANLPALVFLGLDWKSSGSSGLEEPK